ncbi:FN3 domain-containing metallophosphoesterase family protein [Snuella lapsa]|uniref:Metallophosphoesterase n=1 Tax=Snuella lapsa TaxID=870481 RepID=A0ABP6YJB2_9FLAO
MKKDRREFLKSTVGLTALTSLVPAIAVGQSFSIESRDPDLGHVFLTSPYLQNPSPNAITVMFIVNLPSYSYVEFGESEELGKKAHKTENGLVVAYNRVNKITLLNLKPATTYYYRVVSKEISKFDPYNLIYGETIVSYIHSFITPSFEKDDVSVLIMNDLHERPYSIPHLMNLVDKKEMDFVFFNGDVFDYQEDEKQIIDNMLTPCCDEFASNIPFYFVRGNHETRGKFARELYHYFATPKEQQYYEFLWGVTHFTVLDTGEDKPDTDKEYGNIVDFDSYREEQLQWFKKVVQTAGFKKAKFRVVLMHIPFFHSDDWHGTKHLEKLFSSIFNDSKIDICICGHTHRYGVYSPDKKKHRYPIIIGGGPKEGNRTIISLKANSKQLSLKMMRDDGKLVGNYDIVPKE